MHLPFIDKYIIDKEFQYSFILRSIYLVLFMTVSMVVVIIMWNQNRFFRNYLLCPPDSTKVIAWAKENNVKMDSSEFAFQFLAQAKPYTFYEIIITPAIVIFIVNLFVMVFASLYLSYKIAMPLHALKVALRQKVETGRFDKPLVVKEGDEFHELSSLANLLLFVASNPGFKHFVDSGESAPGGKDDGINDGMH